jgi:DNA replication protein DnaC
MNLKKSINVKYDLKDETLIENYYATKSHLEIIKNVINGVHDEGTRSHIAYGPYGAGKSYISTILANLLLKTYDQKTIKKLSDKYNLINSEISKSITNIKSNKTKYLNVTLNGYETDFQEA